MSTEQLTAAAIAYAAAIMEYRIAFNEDAAEAYAAAVKP